MSSHTRTGSNRYSEKWPRTFKWQSLGTNPACKSRSLTPAAIYWISLFQSEYTVSPELMCSFQIRIAIYSKALRLFQKFNKPKLAVLLSAEILGRTKVNLQYHWVVPFHAEACSWEMSLMRQHFSCFFIANFTHFYFLGSEIFQSRTQFCVKVYERDYMISSSIISPKETIWFPLLSSLLKKLIWGTKPDISKLSEGH